MQEKYTKEEAKSLSVGLYVALALIAGTIFFTSQNAIMTMELKDGIRIPDDSSASIVSSGIMGAKYIEIEPGGSEDYLQPGGEFSYTQDAMVIEELVDRIISIGKANRSKAEDKKIDEMEKEFDLN